MEFKKMALVLVFLVLLLSTQPYEATSIRILGGGWEIIEKLHLQSVQRGSVPSSGSSGCTNIPGIPGPDCPVH
ncbi:hypothetical protein ACHQM5_027289 [Ranunculus cassubicifolius]